MLGYTQTTWDNESGQELQPESSAQYFSALTSEEQKAAKNLGYNERSWDNLSGTEPQPASESKAWAQLTTASCDGKDPHLLCLAEGNSVTTVISRTTLSTRVLNWCYCIVVDAANMGPATPKPAPSFGQQNMHAQPLSVADHQ